MVLSLYFDLLFMLFLMTVQLRFSNVCLSVEVFVACVAGDDTSPAPSFNNLPETEDSFANSIETIFPYIKEEKNTNKGRTFSIFQYVLSPYLRGEHIITQFG